MKKLFLLFLFIFIMPFHAMESPSSYFGIRELPIIPHNRIMEYSNSTSDEPPLIRAVKNRDQEVALVFMGHAKKNIDATDANGWSALTWAASRGDIWAVNELCAHGADISLVDKEGNPIYSHAHKNGHKTVCGILHKHLQVLARKQLGAIRDLRAPYDRWDHHDYQSFTWQDYLHKQLWEDIAKKENWFAGHILRLYPEAIKWKDEEGKTPLLHAASCSNWGAVEELIRLGASLDEKDDLNRTVFDFLTVSGHFSHFINSRPPLNPSPLTLNLFLSSSKSIRLMRLFEVVQLDENQELSDETILGMNPWHVTGRDMYSQEEKETAIKIVLDKEFREQLLGKRGIVGAGACLSHSMARTVIALAVCLGANVETQAPSWAAVCGSTPLAWSVNCEHYQLAKYLLKKGARIGHELLKMAWTVPYAKLLLEHKAYVPDDMLDAVCKSVNYKPELLKLYLDRGVRPRERYGNLLDDLIKDEAQKKISILLKTNKVDLFHQDLSSDGYTALHRAALNAYKTGNKGCCMAIINYLWDQHKGFLQFLVYLRKEWPLLYAQKHLLAQQFKAVASNQITLVQLLSLKDSLGALPVNHFEDPELHPNFYKLHWQPPKWLLPEKVEAAQGSAKPAAPEMKPVELKKRKDLGCVCF